jgi:hypothetical protein
MIKAKSPLAALQSGASILLVGQGLRDTLLPVCGSFEVLTTVSIGGVGAARTTWQVCEKVLPRPAAARHWFQSAYRLL